MAVARFVTSLENLLPQTTTHARENQSASPNVSRSKHHPANHQHEEEHQPITSHMLSPLSVVALNDIGARAGNSAASIHGDSEQGVTGDDVRTLLRATRQGNTIDLHTLLALIEGATGWLRNFRGDSKLVKIPPLTPKQTLTVVGDLHGSLSDLATVLAIMPGKEPHSDNLLLFNGDLADRGDHGIETICIVCALCLAYPQHVIVNRGNHEDLALSVAYGLVEELRSKYGARNLEHLTPVLDAFFRALPLATIVEDDALIVHAGPPPPSKTGSLEDLLSATRHPLLGGRGFSRTIFDRMASPSSIKKGKDIIEALLWSDPWLVGSNDENEGGGGCGGYGSGTTTLVLEDDEERSPLRWLPNPSRAGVGYRFDGGVVRDFLNREGLTRMVRSHETVRKGCVRYEIPRDDCDGSNLPVELFTVFSASRYPSKEGFNQGAILELHANGKHKIQRYATEDDDPIIAANANENTLRDEGGNDEIRHHRLASFSSFHRHRPSNDKCAITLDTIRENLFDAIHHHEGAVRRSLKRAATTRASTATQRPLPKHFCYNAKHYARDATLSVLAPGTIIDILIETLNLEGDAKGLETRGAKTVLARALGIEGFFENGTEIDLETFCDSITSFPTPDARGDGGVVSRQQKNHDDDKNNNYSWVHSLFEMLDENNKEHRHAFEPEWLETVGNKIWGGGSNGSSGSSSGAKTSIATRLHGSTTISIEDIRELLDGNKNGIDARRIEWEKLGEAMEDDDDEESYDDHTQIGHG